MKAGHLIQAFSEPDIGEEMALVNQYAKKELTADEVFLFSATLCDNDVDRDFERFTVESLFTLEKLFVGKTGILDHEPTANNQKARIISCRVEAVEGRKTALGDDYFRLTARAYMKRGKAADDLIDAIEAGIVREVSVGCAVEGSVCSVCKGDIRSCSHVKGKKYGGELCVAELTHPTDAYEFSFVAVPAQRDAGVIKALKKEIDMNEVIKSVKESEKLSLEGKELETLKGYIERLEENRDDLDDFKKELGIRVKENMKSAGIELPQDVLAGIIGKCSVRELQAVRRATEKARSRGESVRPQLFSTREKKTTEPNTAFQI